MKKIIVVSVVFLLTFSFCSCGNSQDKEIEDVMQQYLEYWEANDQEGMDSLSIDGLENAELNGFSVTDIKVKEVIDRDLKIGDVNGFIFEDYPDSEFVKYEVVIDTQTKLVEDAAKYLDYEMWTIVYFIKQPGEDSWKVFKWDSKFE